MKTKELKLEVDFIGEQIPLTIDESQALSDYFQKKKASLKLAELRKPIRKTKPKTSAK